MTETQLLRLLLQRAPLALADARIFRRNVGLYYTPDGRPVKVAIEGQADAYALLRGGRIVEIETKAHGGRLSLAQRRWRDFCAAWGVAHVVLVESKGATPDETIADWLGKLRDEFARASRALA